MNGTELTFSRLSQQKCNTFAKFLFLENDVTVNITKLGHKK